MNTEDILVSVIVPIFNVEQYLDQCLTSIENQTHHKLEIICVNDGSTDDSLNIIHEHASQDTRYLIVDKPNEGYGASCNKGIATAHGQWIAIVEPDDWIEPPMYADMLAHAASCGDLEKIDIIKTPYWRITDPDTTLQRKINCDYRYRIRTSKKPVRAAKVAPLFIYHPSIWSALYRTSFLRDHNIRFPEYPGAGWADNPFLMRSLLEARQIVYLDKPYYCYREQSESQYKAAILRNPCMHFDRWHNMQDILDDYTSMPRRDFDTIKLAHDRRGLIYYDDVMQYADKFTPEQAAEAQQLATAMFGRSNPVKVFGCPQVSPSKKETLARTLGIVLPENCSRTWKATLVKEGLHTLRATGPKNTLYMVRRVRK